MINKKDIAIEYVSNYITVCGSAVREDKDEHWYEIEILNDFSRNIFNIKAQLRFYDKNGEFIGFEEDTHDAYLEPNRKVALAIYAKTPADTQQIRFTIDATAEEEDSDRKDTFWVLGFLAILTASAAVIGYFYRQ